MARLYGSVRIDLRGRSCINVFTLGSRTPIDSILFNHRLYGIGAPWRPGMLKMQAAYRPNATELAEILIVDDSLEFTHYVTRILALDFPEVGVGAWDWRRDVPPEDHDWSRTKLIILDYRLGDRDGLAWLEALRSRPGIPPIVLVTSSHDDRLRDRALALGASHFFQKEQLTRPVVAKLVRSACEC